MDYIRIIDIKVMQPVRTQKICRVD